MDNLTYLFAVTVMLAGMLASISIWAPRKLWIRGASAIATAGLVVVAYLGFSDLLSRPKPIHFEWAMSSVDEAQVVASSAKEGEAIFIWLEVEGVSAPRAYQLPWSRELAVQLQEAAENNRDNGTGVRVRSPFDGEFIENEENPTFYSPPRHPAVAKVVRDVNPMVFGDSR
jgi:hypothetical protein